MGTVRNTKTDQEKTDNYAHGKNGQRRVKVLTSGGGLQVLAMLLCLPQLSRHISIGISELQDLLHVLLAPLGPPLELGAEGSDLVTQLALPLLTFLELTSQDATSLPLRLDISLELALLCYKDCELVFGSSHGLLCLVASLGGLIQLTPDLLTLFRGCHRSKGNQNSQTTL